MTAPRRGIVRPSPAPTNGQQQQRQLDRLRARLNHERSALARWQRRLKRAFTAVEKSQKCIARIERKIAQMET
jgi:hypothetical protein